MTSKYKRDPLVKVSQPFFLRQLCLGTILMALTIIPMSLQGEEESPGLSVARQIAPWFLWLGFGVAASALFSKAWRLNQLAYAAQAMQRIRVEERDAMQLLLILLATTTLLLSIWTAVMPFHRWPNVVQLGPTPSSVSSHTE